MVECTMFPLNEDDCRACRSYPCPVSKIHNIEDAIGSFHCIKCGSKNTERCIILNDWFDPRKDGNPIKCNDCGGIFAERNNTYREHLELIRRKL